jgi:tRNA C32,U32 (ribose-2'-O)-methylase TrmJ
MGGGRGFGAYGGTKGSNQRERLMSSVDNHKLKNAVDQIYRPGATVGDGGLADAIRHEKETGEMVGGRPHTQKGRERLKNLENILAKEKLNEQDTKIVNKLISDLKKALEEE